MTTPAGDARDPARPDRRLLAAGFLVELERLVTTRASQRGDEVVWVGGHLLPDDSAVVLYREHPRGPVLGRRTDVEAFGRLFGPRPQATALALIRYEDDLLDPTGHGTVFDVGWADGLGVEAPAIEWVGAGGWTSGR